MESFVAAIFEFGTWNYIGAGLLFGFILIGLLYRFNGPPPEPAVLPVILIVSAMFWPFIGMVCSVIGAGFLFYWLYRTTGTFMDLAFRMIGIALDMSIKAIRRL